ncbi:C40 family peptidase [Intestinibacter sp.]|jgi:cell wall-associated NlpC family hydrolase|uniref:C40 family peptidase n=1 Tax=Intestinibacter sp. TaxID=1965304 RepID=UPI0025F1B85E|nr:C40 family peptidase [uncultured Intestinibacter sp.]
MSINKSYVLAGAAIAATSIVSMTNISTVEAASQIATVTENVNFRTGPSTSYSSITVISKGSSIEVLSTSGNWVNAKYNGKTGYIYKDYVSNSTSTSNSETTQTTKYVNTTAGLNVRTGPSTSYAKIATLSYGQSVNVLSTSNGWSKINYNGSTGYVSSQYLQSTKPSSSSSSETSQTVKYVNTTSGLNMRTGPATSYAKITTIAYGQSVNVLSTSNGWSKINYSGSTGYVSSQYLQSTKPSSSSSSNSGSTSVSSSASSVIAYAKTLLGKPYVWGAQGPNSFDCSGFTYYVFKNKAGIVLPRTSSAQSKYGTSVSWSNLKAGDLMFFDTNGANNGQVSHVGLYIGNGQMIHASSSQRKIVITSVNTSYYKNAFVNARRVL